jgi:hypothetical protein
MWFYATAEPDRVWSLIDPFPRDRLADLWSGVGLAATYAGGAPTTSLKLLLERAGPFRADMAQGAVFGATARVAAGEVLPETAEISLLLSGLAPDDAARLAGEARRGCHEGTADDYERWRERIRGAVRTEVAS